MWGTGFYNIDHVVPIAVIRPHLASLLGISPVPGICCAENSLANALTFSSNLQMPEVSLTLEPNSAHSQSCLRITLSFLLSA